MFQSRPRLRESYIQQAHLKLLEAATREVLGRAHYADLLAVNARAQVKACTNRDAGVEIWEWRGQAPGDPAPTQGLMHSKFVVVDRRLSLVGSYNLDPRSERLNGESAIVFETPALAEQLARRFIDHDLATSRRITAAEAATFDRPEAILDRFAKELAGLFEDQL